MNFEALQLLMTKVALAGALAALLAYLVLRFGPCAARFADAALRHYAALPFPGKVLLPAFLCVAVLFGGSKTNGVDRQNFMSFPPVVRDFQTTDEPLVLAENWHRRGASEDWRRIDFDSGWIFPHGTSHLTRVTVMSYGEVRGSLHDTNSIACLSRHLGMVPYASEFWSGWTSSNTYLLSWLNCRDATNGSVNAAIELFRNGDAAIRDPSGETLLPRILPFPHDGIGQDDDWVLANFTNAAEILDASYAQWVDEQVGTGLENGLYKLTVRFRAPPPETVRLTVGHWSVAVADAGDYVFLLGKGEGYDLDVEPYQSDVACFVTDDLGVPPRLLGGLAASAGAADDLQVSDTGEWTIDYGRVEWWMPSRGRPGYLLWLPMMWVDPGSWTVDDWLFREDCCTQDFEIVTFDVAPWAKPTGYRWQSQTREVYDIFSPTSRMTRIAAFGPAFRQADAYCRAIDAYVVFNDQYEVVSRLLFDYERPPSAVTLSVDMPGTLFVNDDDDDGDGVIDWIQPRADDDTPVCRVTFRSEQPTNGVIGIAYSGDYRGELLENAESGSLSSFDYLDVFEVNDTTEQEISFRMNPSGDSGYAAARIVATWTPSVGPTLTASKRFTVVEPVVRPICTDSKEVADDGVVHTITYNPCGVVVGREAYFKISLNPASYPDSRIVWSSSPSNAVEFVGGDTGREVTVRGVSEGDAELVIRIGDAQSNPPKFPIRVVTNTTVAVRAWIIRKDDGTLAQTPDVVRAMVREANDIYAQVGMTFELQEPIVVTNIQAAYDVVYDGSGTERNWNFSQVVDLASGTGGLECYFVNGFLDEEKDVVAVNSSSGMVLTAKATGVTLAHEIGHACGLDDIYVERGTNVISSVERLVYKHAPDDWNGGSDFWDSAGARYYAPDETLCNVITGLLMYGYRAADGKLKRDIPAGSVEGVWQYGRAEGDSERSGVDAGIFKGYKTTRSPSHR